MDFTKIEVNLGKTKYEGIPSGLNLMLLPISKTFDEKIFDNSNISEDDFKSYIKIHSQKRIKCIQIYNLKSCIYYSEKSIKNHIIDLPSQIIDSWQKNLDNISIFILFDNEVLECFFPSTNILPNNLELNRSDAFISYIDTKHIEYDESTQKFKVKIIGWVYSKESKLSPIRASLYINNKLIISTMNIIRRDDVRVAHELHRPFCGFILSCYSTILDSIHIKYENNGNFSNENVILEKKYRDISKKNDLLFVNFNPILKPPILQKKIQPKKITLSIIVLTKLAHNLCIPLLQKIRTDCPDDEMIIVSHDLDQNNEKMLRLLSDKIISVSGNFNWSRFNNIASESASGEYLLFINDDIFPLSNNWRNNLSGYLSSKVIVGANFISENLTLQHAGIGIHGNTAITLDSPSQNVNAVTGAFLGVNKSVFNNLGKFNENLKITLNDVEFCIRANKVDVKSVVPLELSFYHFESSTRYAIEDDSAQTNDLISDLVLQNVEPDLVSELSSSILISEPIQIIKHHKYVPQKIAVIKLDHIGDFFSSLNAFRNLKKLFPESEITLISSPEVHKYAVNTGIFKNVIPFREFNRISELGKADERLNPLGKFDLALDFRKHGDARGILLSIDSFYKFSMVQQGSDDERRLLEGNIKCFVCSHEGHSGSLKYSVWQESLAYVDFIYRHISSIANSIDYKELPKVKLPLNNIFIFPFSGNSAREWPIDLYIRLAKSLRANFKDSKISFVADESSAWKFEKYHNFLLNESIEKVIPKNLDDLISTVNIKNSFIISNNSGPAWISSELKIPFVGIYSGVVEAMHWLPENGVGIKRNVSCSPCYISSSKECHRQMHCLTSIPPLEVISIVKRMIAS